ncbi:hypothetical protein ElyMa_006202900 [Elysia marginata]|uniref:Uncharacterized protein n=1 Tax=Elysia marginata TaxID=1093978 RepID=A0AAV4H7C6_9GAST|nr:hypothetical protein ElyMa_006202900 [Elysia marginata]
MCTFSRSGSSLPSCIIVREYHLRQQQCAHCASAHRKAKLASHTCQHSLIDRSLETSIVSTYTRTGTISNSATLSFILPWGSKQKGRSSIRRPSSLRFILSTIAALTILSSSVFNVQSAAAQAHSLIPVRVSPITSTSPSNLTHNVTSSKIHCAIGLLVPAVSHNYTAASSANDGLTDYRKQGIHWYSKDVVDIVQEALDEAVRVFQAGHESDDAAKKKGSEGNDFRKGRGQGLVCNVKVEWRDGGWCDEKSALGQAVGLHIGQDVQAFVGPPCHNCEYCNNIMLLLVHFLSYLNFHITGGDFLLWMQSGE